LGDEPDGEGEQGPTVTLQAHCSLLNIDEESHLPLYVQRITKTWQPVAVQIRAPDQPGIYELVIVARDYPHPRLEIDGEYIGNPITEISQLVRLEVKSSSSD